MNTTGESIGGLLFLIMGSIFVLYYKSGARLFVEYQKHFGWTKGSYRFGIVMHLVAGVIFLLIGLMMLFVVRN
jgi:hypothetical protein